MDRDGFVFYRSFYNCLKNLSIEYRDKLSMAIFEYALDWIEPELDWMLLSMFDLIRPQIDANNKRYINWCKWWQYGSKWWRPPKTWDNSQKPQDNPNETPSEPQPNPNLTPKDKDKDKDKDKGKDKDKEKECEGKEDDITTLDAKASRVPITTTQSNVISGLGKEKTQDIKQTNTQWLYNDVGSALWFEDIYKNFYHKNWIKKDEKKSKKLFDTMNFSQKELQDILYDEKLFKFEFKYRIKDPQYRPKFDTYLSGFNRSWDRQWDDRLYEIAKYHMTHKDDLNKMKERSTELKEAFWESKFKEIAHNVWRELSRVNLVIK